ncbi:peptidoglycan-binding protein [Streptomyces sp. NBC_00829]|uniref:peptidoglycan-binding protein n=1 Tax=Streptomyces sp. NBC_00829 TaxID=2903679 RepID=UPI0038633D3D|nr:peptidoglycan-binding protein [Streptomyces sp. NBC_00829]
MNRESAPASAQAVHDGSDGAQGPSGLPVGNEEPGDETSGPGAGPEAPARPRRRVRGWLIGGTALVATGGCAVALLTLPRQEPKPAAGTTSGATAPVTRTDLVEQEKADGKLGFAGSYPITARSSSSGASASRQGSDTTPSGTANTTKDNASQGGANILTWLPSEGQTISRGKQVYGRDGRPVPLFYGSTPFWRELKSGMTDGTDVWQLEKNLEALGYGTGLTVDKHFSDGTAQAVKRWQKAQGLARTGAVAPGDVVVEPSAVRITKVEAALGATTEGTILQATGTSRLVTVELAANRAALAKRGASVVVELPGGKTASGHVSHIGTVARANRESGGPADQQPGATIDKATITVKVTLDKLEEAGELDGAPVTVLFTSAEHKGVLAVPITALVATPQGGYAVQVVRDDSTTRTVTVELGAFGGGKVAVSSPHLRDGMKVRVPSS